MIDQVRDTTHNGYAFEIWNRGRFETGDFKTRDFKTGDFKMGKFKTGFAENLGQCWYWNSM